MLSIANSWLLNEVALGETLVAAVAEFEGRLDTRGLIAFDPEDETQRNRAIRACVEASLGDLEEDKLHRLGELAILPEDENIPLSVIEALWAESGGLDKGQAGDLIRRFHGLSLLQTLDLRARTLRLHDNMVWYLRDRIGPDGVHSAHRAMTQAISSACNGKWETLPGQHTYGWRFLIRHLRGAGLGGEADDLLVDYAWIKAKLLAVGPWELATDYRSGPADEGAQLVGRAISLSLPALAANLRELPRQLFGRLGEIKQETTNAIVAAAQHDPEFRPAPRWPGLTGPGAERLRLIGHESLVLSAAFSPHGAHVVTASDDRTARIWDAPTGREITALRGHEEWVWSAAFSPDGARIVTASADRTARIWDAATGREIIALRGHKEGVCQVRSPRRDGVRFTGPALHTGTPSLPPRPAEITLAG